MGVMTAACSSREAAGPRRHGARAEIRLADGPGLAAVASAGDAPRLRAASYRAELPRLPRGRELRRSPAASTQPSRPATSSCWRRVHSDGRRRLADATLADQLAACDGVSRRGDPLPSASRHRAGSISRCSPPTDKAGHPARHRRGRGRHGIAYRQRVRGAAWPYLRSAPRSSATRPSAVYPPSSRTL